MRKEPFDTILENLEKFRYRLEEKRKEEPTDWVVRVCEAIVAEEAGYKNRTEWNHLQPRG